MLTMKRTRDITPSEIGFLKNVVDLYIQTGGPVSSSSLKTSFRLGASTAGIRKIMHRLEEKGYLQKPHVSAGRIPTDIGYRFYVDEIRTFKPLDARIVEEIQSKIRRDWSDVRDVMYRTSRILGELTSYMGIIMGIFDSQWVVRRLQIIQLEGGKGLAVLTLIPHEERKLIIDFPKRYPASVIDRSVQIINERIASYPLEEAQERLDEYLRSGGGAEREIAEIISAEAEYLFDWVYDLKYHFKGFEEQLAIPELNNTKTLQNLVRIMGERSIMLKVLKNRFEDDVTVTIGHENEEEGLEDFSLVTRRFDAGMCGGILGILGPTRMSYHMVLSILKRMAEELQRLELKGS